MVSRSWRGVMGGAVIALALPIAYSAYALLLSSGIVPVTRTGFVSALLSSLTLNVLAELVLGATGVAIVGWAARIQNGWALLAMWIVALPLLAIVWFLSYATLGGAMGSPF